MAIRVTKEGDQYIARFDWDVATKDLIKAAGFKFDGQRKLWWTTDPKIAAKVSGNTDEITDRLNQERLETQRRKQEMIDKSRAADSQLDIPLSETVRKRGFDFFPYQKAGVEFALKRPATLIGDEMGLGKTMQALGLINADPSIKNVLVICPASLKLNWQREAKLWLSRPIEVSLANGSFAKGGLVIVNYEMVAKYRAQIDSVHWDLLVVDECHYIKNPKAQRTTAILGKWHQDENKRIEAIKAKRRMFLTGTPVLNRPNELWTLVHALDPFGLGKSWLGFHTRYCAAYKDRWGWQTDGASNLDELQAKLRSSIMIRRLKADVLPDLPPMRRQIIAMEPATPDAIAAVRDEQQAVQAIEEKLDQLRSDVEKLSVDEASEEYKAAAGQLAKARAYAFEETQRVRHRVALAKVPQVIDYLRDALESTDKLIVFTYHHDMTDAIVAALSDEVGVVKFDGRDSLPERDEAMQAFQNDKAVRLFVGSIGAAREGLTLTAASTVIFCELDWTPGNLAQAEARAHRIGQKDSVLVQHLVLDGSIDARMTEIIVSKMDTIKAVVDEGEQLPDVEELARPKVVKYVPKANDEDVLSAEQIAAIHTGLKHLASMCDGAHELDNHGFNKLDTDFGHSLANAPRLSQKQAKYGKKLCIKYGRQLSADLLQIIKG